MKLISVREAAKRLDLKESTVTRYCRNRDIPTVKLSNTKGYRFIESEINKWIKEKRIPARRRN